jgi:HEAT repeat protein
MLLLPSQYADAPLRDLLHEAGRGRIGVDQAFVKAILDRGPEAAAELAAYGLDQPEEDRVDLTVDLFHIFRALRHPAAIPFLIDLLHQDDGEAPDHIYEALGELGEAAVEPLLELREKADEESRGNMEFLLAGLGVQDDRIKQLLLERLETDPADAAINLSLYGDKELIPAIAARLERMGEEEQDEKRELEYSMRNLEAPVVDDGHPPYDVFENFEAVAPPVWDVLDAEEIVEFLQHPDPNVRKEAAEALVDEEPDEVLLDALVGVAENDEDAVVRGSAWQSLSEYWEEPGVAAKLREKMADAGAPARERAGAAIAVATNELNPAVEAVLRELYENEETRPQAMRGMWRTFDKTFAPIFSKHLQDPIRTVQNEAITGVGYLGMVYESKQLEDMFDDPDLRERALFAYALCCAGDTTRSNAKKLYRKIADLAGGLNDDEKDVVETAIDTRLALHGLGPVFAEPHEH